MPGYHVWFDSNRVQKRVQRLVSRKHGLNGTLHLPKLTGGRDARGRKYDLAWQEPPRMREEGTIHQVKPGTNLGKMKAKVDQHSGILRTLSREKKSHSAAYSLGCVEKVNAAPIFNPRNARICQSFCSKGKFPIQIRWRRTHNRKPKFQTVGGQRVERVRQVVQRQLRRILQSQPHLLSL